MSHGTDTSGRPTAPIVDTGHLVLAAAVGFVLEGVATEAALSTTLVVGLLGGAVLLVGPSAALGGTFGLVVHDLFRGAVGYWTLGAAVWLLAFSGGVVWLAPRLFVGRDERSSHSTGGAMLTYVRAAVVAGVYASALAAWTVALSGGARFYTVAIDFLPGIVPAAVLGVAVLVVASDWVDRPLDVPVEGDRPLTRSTRWGQMLRSHARSAGPTRATVVGMAVVGVCWVVGVTGIDVLAHDLGQFTTASELRSDLAGTLSPSSLLGTVVTTVLVAIYRYGEATVVLSAPLALAVTWLLGRFRSRPLRPSSLHTGVVDRGGSDD